MSDTSQHNDLCVGIDLGTTNSVLATINIKANGDVVSKVVDIPRAVDMYSTMSEAAKFQQSKKPTLPSCVYYDEERNYQAVVGDFAKNRYSLRPHLVARSIKSQMGNALAEGLAEGVPDRTPAEISSRIIEHLLKTAGKIYRTEIHDAIITVPANFDSVMCKATRDAAELAGINVLNEDGSERPILLSEPNAVIYDFINQVHNGEISDHIIDLSQPKNVLVFDLGGGTLDITLHKLARREDNPDILKVKEIATNRYTLLGGDDFDEEIAKAMYQHYLAQYQKHPDIVHKIRREEKPVMAQLRSYAEELKLELSSRHGDEYVTSGWDDEEEDFPVGGTINSTGYAYDDSFVTTEIENILAPFLGSDLVFEDYRRLAAIKDTRNIIYPILDVLAKAEAELGKEQLKIDAVIMNGGMSRFYLITDRLEKFFGFPPIVALDPDQSVARGAAVYHYYLHKFDALREDMKKVGTDTVAPRSESPRSATRPKSEIENQTAPPAPASEPTPSKYIEWGKPILNDALYLGARNDTHVEIIPTGAELPYTSEIMTGYRLMPGNDHIELPIQSQNIDNSYRTMARGKIQFKNDYKDGSFVALQIYMRANKVITLTAWTSQNENGSGKIEEGSVDIVMGGSKRVAGGPRVIARIGSKLNPVAELQAIEQKCQAYESVRGKNPNTVQKKRVALAKEIRTLTQSVRGAGNPNDFAEPILEAIRRYPSAEFVQRCFIIARHIGLGWTPEQKRRLAELCLEQVRGELQGFDFGGFGFRASTGTKIQALYTLHMCGEAEDIAKIEQLHTIDKFQSACLYTHAKTKTQVGWIYEKFLRDRDNVLHRRKSNLQNSAHAIGVAFCDTDAQELDGVNRSVAFVELRDLIAAGRINSTELICCVIAMGCLGDQRQRVAIDEQDLYIAMEILNSLPIYYNYTICQYAAKAKAVALKLLRGVTLTVDDERFLLEKLNV
ncbi:MAG: Hsp70 family protein [Selenomonadaceae bacterium]|nr:Hsp70 family protein [Selenomonadaceae bacterium]